MKHFISGEVTLTYSNHSCMIFWLVHQPKTCNHSFCWVYNTPTCVPSFCLQRWLPQFSSCFCVGYLHQYYFFQERPPWRQHNRGLEVSPCCFKQGARTETIILHWCVANLFVCNNLLVFCAIAYLFACNSLHVCLCNIMFVCVIAGLVACVISY